MNPVDPELTYHSVTVQYSNLYRYRMLMNVYVKLCTVAGSSAYIRMYRVPIIVLAHTVCTKVQQ